MTFYLVSSHKIEAYEHSLNDFASDDLLTCIQDANTKIAVDEHHLRLLIEAYPAYYVYKVKVNKL